MERRTLQYVKWQRRWRRLGGCTEPAANWGLRPVVWPHGRQRREHSLVAAEAKVFIAHECAHALATSAALAAAIFVWPLGMPNLLLTSLTVLWLMVPCWPRHSIEALGILVLPLPTAVLRSRHPIAPAAPLVLYGIRGSLLLELSATSIAATGGGCGQTDAARAQRFVEPAQRHVAARDCDGPGGSLSGHPASLAVDCLPPRRCKSISLFGPHTGSPWT